MKKIISGGLAITLSMCLLADAATEEVKTAAIMATAEVEAET